MSRSLFEPWVQPPLAGFEPTFVEARMLAVACLDD